MDFWILDGLSPFGIGVEEQGFGAAWDIITGQKFPGVGLNLKAFILTFRDLASHLCQCQRIMRVAGSTDLECESCSWTWDFSKPHMGRSGWLRTQCKPQDG